MVTTTYGQGRVVKHRPNIFRLVLLYVLSKVRNKRNVGETVLQKILFYIEFDYYEKFETALMGETYIRASHGPMNKRLRPVLQGLIYEGAVVKIEDRYFDHFQTRYQLVGECPALESLSPCDLGHIDRVLSRLSELNGSEISEYSHDDIPWKCTLPDMEIAYELVFYRDSRYSVKEFDDEI